MISPNFLVWKFCEKAQFPHSFGRARKIMRKLCLSTKFPHQEIRWNHGILRSAKHKRSWSNNFIYIGFKKTKCLFSYNKLQCVKLTRRFTDVFRPVFLSYRAKWEIRKCIWTFSMEWERHKPACVIPWCLYKKPCLHSRINRL